MTGPLNLSLIRLTQGWHVRAYDCAGRLELVHQHIFESRRQAAALRRRIRAHLDRGGYLDDDQWYRLSFLADRTVPKEPTLGGSALFEGTGIAA